MRRFDFFLSQNHSVFSRISSLSFAVLTATSMLLGGLSATYVSGQTLAPPQIEPAVQGSLRDDLSQFTEEEKTHIRVYENCNRSVVNITTKLVTRDAFFMTDEVAEGAGSGSVLDKDGHILTNFHVIENSNQIRVTLYDGRSYAAEVVGADPPNDIAVLKIVAPPSSLIPLPMGDSSKLKVGQRAYAIGNPFGLERTMTVGVVSSLNRSLNARGTERKMKSIIQIDAALNRGNSGGPLINSRSELIGMNTAIASRVGENTGVGFAIPINTIKRVVPQLIENGKVVRADIGILRTWNAPDGLGIAVLEPNGPAEKAGLQAIRVIVKRERQGPFIVQRQEIDPDHSDRVIAIDGKLVETVDDLLSHVESKTPGDKVTLTILRNGREMEVAVTLGVEE